MPYLNSNGVVAQSPDVQTALIDRAVLLADELNVKHLELRHETPIDHTALNGSMTSKVHMRLTLPTTTDLLWKNSTPRCGSIRKGERARLTVTWGGSELLDPFYVVMSHNMRDLGTPIYSRGLFASILDTFLDSAELCLVRSGEQP